jgi:transcriptional regulator with XRE-family HTH domain
MVRLPLTSEEIQRGERLGALLRHARGDRSMLDVALEAGISPETLRKIESGRVATPAFPTVAALATALGLSLDHIWSAVSSPQDPVGRRRPATASLLTSG